MIYVADRLNKIRATLETVPNLADWDEYETPISDAVLALKQCVDGLTEVCFELDRRINAQLGP